MALHSITGDRTVVYEAGLIPHQDLDGGVVRLGGNVDTDRWTNRRLGDNTPENDLSIAISGVNTTGIALGGTSEFGKVDHVIRMVTTDIAGVSNTRMSNSSSNSSQVAHTPLNMRVARGLAHKLAIQANAWNQFTASWDAGFPQSFTSGAYNLNTNADGSTAVQDVDNASSPSRATPGEFVFLVGGKVITSGDYEAKNG